MRQRCLRGILILMMTACCLLSTWAQGGVRLSMTFRNESLPGVLLRLEKNSSYKFLFTYEDLEPYRVTGVVHDATLFQIVDYVLRGKPLSYTVQGKFINIVKGEKSAVKVEKGKMQTVGGYVYDAKTKEPIIGAQVRIVGTKILAVTDLNGAFSFDYFLQGGGNVQVSYVGMQTRIVPLQKEMKIGLNEDTQTLDNVVVTGIFRKAKESYTGSVSTVSKEQLQQFRGQNLLQT